MRYTDYYPPAKLRTLTSLLETYQNRHRTNDDVKKQLFGTRDALTKEFSTLGLFIGTDQTLANRIDALVSKVNGKTDKTLEQLWLNENDYQKLWWSLVYFVNKYPLRPLEGFDDETMLQGVAPEELILLIDKIVIPVARILMNFLEETGSAKFLRSLEFFLDLDKQLPQQYKNSIAEDDFNKILSLWNWKRPLYYLALSISIVKNFKLIKKNGIEIEAVIVEMEKEDILPIIFNDNKEQQEQVLEALKEYIPQIKTTWQAYTMLAFVIYTQQTLIKPMEKYGTKTR